MGAFWNCPATNDFNKYLKVLHAEKYQFKTIQKLIIQVNAEDIQEV